MEWKDLTDFLGKLPARLLVFLAALAAAAFALLVFTTLASYFRFDRPLMIAGYEFGAKGVVLFAAPPDAVVAFANTESATDASKQCPKYWHAFEEGRGRVIVGAGIPTKDNFKTWLQVQLDGSKLSVPLTGYDPLTTGGEQAHILSIAEMPMHNHNNGGYNALLHYSNGNNTASNEDFTVNQPDLDSYAPLIGQGGNQPHNTMPPYIALYYCQKDK